MAQVARSAQAWVTEDSVSMVYESLPAGAATGLLAVPRQGETRTARHGRDRWREEKEASRKPWSVPYYALL